jgi:hypothetical protein
MCIVLAVILAVFAFNAWAAGNVSLGLLGIVGSVFFTVLMVRNIAHVKRFRSDKAQGADNEAEEGLPDKQKGKGA